MAEIGQLTKDLYVLEAIRDLLGFGKIYHENKRGLSKIRFDSSESLTSFIQFLHEYPLTGFKRKQFGLKHSN